MSWIEKNQKPLLAVGAILGIAWFGGRYFDESESYSAEKFKRRKIDAETRKKVGEAVSKEVAEVFPDIFWSGLENGQPMTQKGFIDSVRTGCDESWPLESDFLTMRYVLKRNGFYEGWDKWEDDEPYTDEYLQKTMWPECKRQIIARAKRDAPEIVAEAKEEYGDKYNAETFHAEKKPLARNTIKAKGRNSYDRFKHNMEMKVKMLSPHFKKKYAKENRLPSFTSGGTTRYWQAYVDGWREMENAKVKDMGDVIGLGFKPENAFSVNEYWGRIDGAEAYLDWSAGRKDASGYYSKTYYIPTEEYDVMNAETFNAEKKKCNGCGVSLESDGYERVKKFPYQGKLYCMSCYVQEKTGMWAETFDAMSFKQWSDDEMHEPKHGGSQMQFDDWLEEEIDSHGDIPLSKWGYEEEHDEKEHQHSESFNALDMDLDRSDCCEVWVEKLYDDGKIGFGQAGNFLVGIETGDLKCSSLGSPNCSKHDSSAETFEAQSKLPKLTPKQMDFLRYSPWAMAYNAYARGTNTGAYHPSEWSEKYTICRGVTGDGWGNENIARRMLQSLLEKKVVAATETSFVDYDGRIRKSYAEQVNENPALVKNISSVCLVLTPIGLEIIKRHFARQVKDVVGWKIQLALGNGETAYLDNVPTDIAQSLDAHIGGVKWDSQKEKFEAEYEVIQEMHDGFQQHIASANSKSEAQEVVDTFPPKYRHYGKLKIVKNAEEMACETCGCKKKAETFNADDEIEETDQEIAESVLFSCDECGLLYGRDKGEVLICSRLGQEGHYNHCENCCPSSEAYGVETFEAKGDCKECYGTGGLYDSHMGINDECHFCGGTGFEY